MTETSAQAPFLVVENLQKSYTSRQGFLIRRLTEIKAVRGVSFAIPKGQTLGLVGESGCGKSTLGKMLIRLIEPSAGSIFLDNSNVTQLKASELRPFRKKMQIIFQDPYASLNPRMTVRQHLVEPLRIHKICDRGEPEVLRTLELMDMVGLRKDGLDKYPHEFSGGQRQRIGIARAIAVNPEFIVCDEPVSALDVSIQAQVINLLQDLQKQLNLTYLFISHDLKVVQHIADSVAVMYLGKIVEMASWRQIFTSPKHPYTRALLSAIPSINFGNKTARIVIKGEMPSAKNPPPGCSFHTRCPFAKASCRQNEPALVDLGQQHWVACPIVNKI